MNTDYSQIRIEQVDAFTFDFYDALNRYYLKVEIDAPTQLIIYTWHLFVPVEAIINTYIAVGKFIYAHQLKIIKGVSDLQYSEGSFEQHNDWMSREYLPKSIKHGYKATAYVKPQDFYTALALELFLENNPEGHQYKILNTKEEALEWLKGIE
ncbi:MAG: hypothetical protein EAZ55_13875 [Cytophagales bacterium]|nr:MAG: hypothetical protein EAZ55_13875 [Cytophagales bacterium]